MEKKLKFIFTVLVAFIYFKISYQQDENERINEGASTSRQDLSKCEECEIAGYADRIVRLLVAYDRNRGDLTYLMNNDPSSLEAFHDEIISYFILAEYGAKAYSDVNRRAKRLNILREYINTYIVTMIHNACREHYQDNLWYEYNRENNMILVREHISFSSNNNLCENYEERRRLNLPLVLPEYNFSEKIHQHVVIENGVSTDEVVPYHVIPLSLIAKFFQVWLSSDASVTLNANASLCATTMFHRLKRSLQKLIIVKLIRSRRFFTRIQHGNENIHFNVDRLFSVETLEQADGWLNGNIFLGPENRGPFNPNFDKDEEELLDAFEDNAKEILGNDQYNELLHLFSELRDFLIEAEDMSSIERLTEGFDRFFLLYTCMNRYDITLMNREQWENRRPKNKDLKEVKSDELKRDLKNTKFWAIKKKPKRFQRSVDYHRTNEDTNENLLTHEILIKDLKRHWSKFVIGLMKISIEARSDDQTFIWLSNFTCMYNDYLFNHFDETNTNCSTCGGFDEYLYDKIISFREWGICNSNEKTLLKSDWCLAWRRILNSSIETELEKNSHKNFRNHKHRSKLYLQEAETIVFWLSSQLKTKKKIEYKTNLTKLSLHSFESIEKTGSALTIPMCYFKIFASTVTLLMCPDNYKTIGKIYGFIF